MALLLIVSGPGVSFRRAAVEGQAPLIVGRDARCELHLPDEGRSLSRRHLAVWCEQGVLRLRVLSMRSGVQTSLGPYGSGELGEVAAGGWLQLGPYRIDVEADESAFGPSTLLCDDALESDDPFASSGANRSLGTAAHAVSGTGPWALLLGLGLDPQRFAAHDEAQWRAAGETLRVALLGLLALVHASREQRQRRGGEDRTRLADGPETNPLRAELPPSVQIEYLLHGHPSLSALQVPEQAVREAVEGLLRDRQAQALGLQALADGLLQEFSPDRLRQTLPARSGVLQSARLWEAWVRQHAQWSADAQSWRERQIAKYFDGAYQKALAAGQRRRR